MAAKLYAVPGSHPSAAVERALTLKGMPYERVDLLPVAHKLQQRLRFPGASVPGLVLDGGEKVQGSVAIVRRLDQLVPDPALFPTDPAARAEVELAEGWGDEVLQSVARRLAWAALKRAPGAMPSYAEGAKLPVPVRVAAMGSGAVAFAEVRINKASEANARADLGSLHHHLDRVDRWIEAGVLGGDAPNAADLQIASSLRLLLTIGDVAPLLEGRPAAALALAQFPAFPGHVPAGTFPAGWLPSP